MGYGLWALNAGLWACGEAHAYRLASCALFIACYLLHAIYYTLLGCGAKTLSKSWPYDMCHNSSPF